MTLVKRAILALPGVRTPALAIYNRWFTTEAVARRNTRAAYQKLYASDRLRAGYLTSDRLAFYQELAGRVLESQPRSILDVGAGTGHLLRAVADRRQGLRLVGVDWATSGIAVARALVPEAEWQVGNIHDLQINEQFDVVLASEVLEHLEEPSSAVDALLRHRAPGGCLVVTVPDGATDTWEGHTNFWTEQELSDWLASWGGVQVVRLDGGAILAARVQPT